MPRSSVCNLEIFHLVSVLPQGVGAPMAGWTTGAHLSLYSKQEPPGKGLAGFIACCKGEVGGCSLFLRAVFLFCTNLQLLPPPGGCCCHPLLDTNGAERAQLGLTQLQPQALCLGTGPCTTELQPGARKGTRWPQDQILPGASASSSSCCQPACPLGGQKHSKQDHAAVQAWGELQ